MPISRGAGITPLAKIERLIASSAGRREPPVPAAARGLAVARDRRLMVMNDDDFGITKQRTRINLVSGVLD